jgi:hypothetical protein
MSDAEEAIVIYLDQSHLSRMTKSRLGVGRPDAEANLLMNELERLVDDRRIICPYAFAHVMESTKYDNARIRHESSKIVGRLSQGRCFKAPFDVVRDELTSAMLDSGSTRTRFSALGNGLDCFARDGTTNAERLDVGANEPTAYFGRIVETLYSDTGVRARTQSFVDILYGVDLAVAKLKQGPRMTLAQARDLQRDAIVNGPMFKKMIFSTSSRFGRSIPDVEMIALADDMRALPTLKMMIEIRARRNVKFDRVPHEGDPIDLVHLLAMPYCDMLLTERFVASIARESSPVGCKVLAQATELRELLGRMFLGGDPAGYKAR